MPPVPLRSVGQPDRYKIKPPEPKTPTATPTDVPRRGWLVKISPPSRHRQRLCTGTLLSAVIRPSFGWGGTMVKTPSKPPLENIDRPQWQVRYAPTLINCASFYVEGVQACSTF